MAASSLSKSPGLRQRLLFARLFSATATSSPLHPPPPTVQEAAKGNERGAWSKFLLFLPGVITFGLGTWQVFRRVDKIEMLEYRTRRLDMEPIIWNQMHPSDPVDLESLEFRKIICEGDFDEGSSIYVGPRSRSISGVTENGYYVITPLVPRPTDSSCVQKTVLVNRGWVPRSWRDKILKDHGNIKKNLGLKEAEVIKETKPSWWNFWSKSSTSEVQDTTLPPVRVVGVIRGSEKPSIFVPPNDPYSGQWFYVDVPFIAHSCGLPEDTIYIEDINENVNPTNPYPIPKDANTLIRYSVMPQDHLNYTITWYSLSAAVTFMAAKRVKAKKMRL